MPGVVAPPRELHAVHAGESAERMRCGQGWQVFGSSREERKEREEMRLRRGGGGSGRLGLGESRLLDERWAALAGFWEAHAKNAKNAKKMRETLMRALRNQAR